MGYVFVTLLDRVCVFSQRLWEHPSLCLIRREDESLAAGAHHTYKHARTRAHTCYSTSQNEILLPWIQTTCIIELLKATHTHTHIGNLKNSRSVTTDIYGSILLNHSLFLCNLLNKYLLEVITLSYVILVYLLDIILGLKLSSEIKIQKT